MKNFSIISFLTGIASGALALMIFSAGVHLFHPAATPVVAGGFQSGQGGGNPARMAQRLGITQDALQKELASGKTMQQIAQEHGVTMPAGGGRRTGTGALSTGTGSFRRPSGSGSTSSIQQ